jgi:hypothetical protein
VHIEKIYGLAQGGEQHMKLVEFSDWHKKDFLCSSFSSDGIDNEI